MQAAHERAEEISRLATHSTERLKLRETELLILHGYVSPTQKKLKEAIVLLQESDDGFKQEYLGEFPAGAFPIESREEERAEDSLRTLTKMVGDRAIAKMDLAQCKKTEEQMLGIQKQPPLSALPKFQGDPGMPPPAMSAEVQAKARAYKLATGRSPSAKEIQRWMGSKY
jgi:hypothetical protein